MKLYRIRNWNDLFENNRSRTVENLTWVAIPNRHDGENYSGIMAHKDGAIIFAAWVLVIQVASRCQPRGSLLRDNQTPHSTATLSLKTRAPQKWFDIALDYLEKNTDWLDVEEFGGDCQAAVSQASGGCQAGDEGGKGRKEGKGRECVAVFPASLSSENFVIAWNDWRQHRREIRKPMTALAEQRLLDAMGKLGEARALLAIDHSIANGWTGIFEPKAQKPKIVDQRQFNTGPNI